MTLSVCGIGWLSKKGYGCVRLGFDHQFTEGEDIKSLVKLGIFSQPFKNFGRLDGMSRMTVSAVALTLKDAGIGYSPAMKQGIGIIGTGCQGSLQSDIDYFRDFAENGRTLSRANLFIYTLPSSAMGEAAIHCGLTGPLLYASGLDETLDMFLDMATEMVVAGEAEQMLVGTVAGDEALYLLIDGKQGSGALCSLSEARLIIASTDTLQEILHKFSLLAVKKGVA